jgi:4-amino-4-deoxy-L-arabinose transferase-like glycosyltransferase
MKQSTLLLILVISALVIRCVAYFAYSDSFYNTSRLIPQFSVAHNIVSGNGASIDKEFVDKAGRYINSKQRLVAFDELHSKFASGKLDSNPEITDTWGMAYITAFFWWITNSRSYIPIQFLQILIDSFTVLPIYWLTLLLFSRKEIAVIAAISYIVFPSFLFLSTTLNRDYYSAWGLIWSTFLFVSWTLSENKNLWKLLAAISILSITLWFRPTILFVPVIWCLYYLFYHRNWSGIRTIIPILLVMFTIEFVVFVLPFSLQYHSKYSEYNFSSGLNGGAFWAGLGEFENKYHFVCNDDSAMARAVQLGYPADGTLYTPEFSRLLKEDAMQVVRQDPMFFVSVLVKRYGFFFFARPPFGVSERSNIHFARMSLPIMEFIRQYPIESLELVAKAVVAVLLPLCAIALLIVRRKEWKSILLLLMLWQYPLIVHLPTHLENRYVVPHLFALIIATSCLGYYLYRKIYHRIPIQNP